jgi:hypothetical protein
MNRTTYVATYEDRKQMQKEVDAAVRYGWTVQNTSAVGGHINVGRTVAPAVFTGGLSLLLGASRSKDKITLTFKRDEAYSARTKLDLHRADWMESIRECNPEKLTNSQLAVDNDIRALAAVASPDSEALEKELTAHLERLIQDIDALNRNQQKFVAMASSFKDSYRLAAKLGVDLRMYAAFEPDHVDREIVEVNDRAITGAQLLSQAHELLTSQEGVMKCLGEWLEASKQQRKPQAKLDDVEKRVVRARAEFERSRERSDAEWRSKRLQQAEEERDSSQSDLNACSAQAESLAIALQQTVAQRNTLAAQLLEAISTKIDGDEAQRVKRWEAKSNEAEGEDAPEAERAPLSNSGEDTLGQIERLSALHSAGVLTDDEFTAKKAELLSRL